MKLGWELEKRGQQVFGAEVAEGSGEPGGWDGCTEGFSEEGEGSFSECAGGLTTTTNLAQGLCPSAPLTIQDTTPPSVLGTRSGELTILEGLKRNMCKFYSFQGEGDLRSMEIRNDGGGRTERETERLLGCKRSRVWGGRENRGSPHCCHGNTDKSNCACKHHCEYFPKPMPQG